MGTFIVSFIGNGFVMSAQNSPLLSRLSPKARRRLLVLLYFTVGTATTAKRRGNHYLWHTCLPNFIPSFCEAFVRVFGMLYRRFTLWHAVHACR